MTRLLLASVVGVLFSGLLPAADPDLAAYLAKPVVGPRHTVNEVIEYCDARIPATPRMKDANEWRAFADKTRADVLANVVFRGEAARWRDHKVRVERLGAIPSGAGYKLTKLRYEALPGFWVPALLYEPEKLTGKVPVVLNVNGHDGAGKAAPYKQVRCVNLARKGLIALNVDWVGMGQLRADGFNHARMNQLDLCGTSGLAPFYLNMSRGIDALLAHPNADPTRVAVTGLSGGGWQTIVLSSLDTRVTLTNPVAGYSSFRTRARHPKDLGDSEQTPTDLAVYADYATLTAMMAPRPTLLTNNATDNCCFEAGYTLPPLLRAAEPAFRLFGKADALRSHVNHDPGDHNYGRDNREAFYRMVGDFFFAGEAFDAKEIPSDDEVKKPAELTVELPEGNKDFNALARDLAAKLPNVPATPADRAGVEKWQATLRERLRSVVKIKEFAVRPEPNGSETAGDVTVTYRRLRLGADWTVPAVELARGTPKRTAVVLADGGRKAAAAKAAALLADGYRVIALDPLGIGEARMIHPGGDQREPKFDRDELYSLLLSTIGDRLLGLQVSQVAAVCRWSVEEFESGPVRLVAVGPRVSLAALVVAGLEEKAVGSVEVSNPPGSLKEAIERNRSYSESPEVFCFGLLEAVDVSQIATLCAPRPLTVTDASERAKKEFAGLKAVYAALGAEFDPMK
jgi:dienelactone hydrolase